MLYRHRRAADQCAVGACAEEKWDEAARLAQDIVGAAGGIGLAAMTQAARHFAQASRDGESVQRIAQRRPEVVGEHVRARKALINLYPASGHLILLSLSGRGSL